jgi:hypothetical protein
VIVRVIVLGIALVAMMGAAAQAEEDDFGRPGFYVGGAFALGLENFDAPDYIEFETAIGVDVWAGYRIIPYLAAELEVEYLTGFGVVSGPDFNYDVFNLGANAKAYVLTGRVQPFALVGIGMTDLSVSEFSTDHVQDFFTRFGLGVDIYITEHFSVGAKGSYVLTTGDLDGFDHMDVTIGGQFRF